MVDNIVRNPNVYLCFLFKWSENIHYINMLADNDGQYNLKAKRGLKLNNLSKLVEF